MTGRGRLVWAATLAGALLVPGAAGADDPPRPHAAVLLHAAQGVDAFIPAYLFEVAATVLRSHGYRTAPQNTSAAQLERAGLSSTECANDDDCVRDVAAALDAPTLIFLEVASLPQGQVSVSIATVEVSWDALLRGERRAVEGTETEAAEQTQSATAALAGRTPPCRVEVVVRGAAGVGVRVDGGAADAGASPLFLRPGAHDLVITATGRASWTGAMTCVAGHRYRVSVR